MKAIITGCHGDIGFAILQYLLKNHYDVLAIDHELDRLRTLNSNHLRLLKLDLSDPQTLSTEMNHLNDAVDVLIYAAGIREIKPLTEITLNEWQKVFDVNVTSAFLISQQAIKLAVLRQKPLSIVFISSISGLQGESSRHAYCASKHALIGLAKSIAIEQAKNNIRANVIAPGLIETAMTKPYLNNEALSKTISSHIPLQKWGKPDHIVRGVESLLQNDYITGTTFVIDGGWLAGKDITHND